MYTAAHVRVSTSALLAYQLRWVQLLYCILACGTKPDGNSGIPSKREIAEDNTAADLS